MRIILKSPAIALTTALLLSASATSAHLYIPSFSGGANGSVDAPAQELRVAQASPWLSNVDMSSGPERGEDVRRPATRPAVLASLRAAFPWVPAVGFDVLGPFEFETVDPRTGRYAEYADGDQRPRAGPGRPRTSVYTPLPESG